MAFCCCLQTDRTFMFVSCIRPGTSLLISPLIPDVFVCLYAFIHHSDGVKHIILQSSVSLNRVLLDSADCSKRGVQLVLTVLAGSRWFSLVLAGSSGLRWVCFVFQAIYKGGAQVGGESGRFAG